MNDEASLREKTRVAIRAGSLPNRLPDRVWGGPATTGRCCICGESTRAHGSVEFEILFCGDPHGAEKSCRVHPHCLTVFESEVQNRPVDGQAANAVAVANGAERGDRS